MRKCQDTVIVTDPGDNPHYVVGQHVRCDCLEYHEGPHRNGAVLWRVAPLT